MEKLEAALTAAEALIRSQGEELLVAQGNFEMLKAEFAEYRRLTRQVYDERDRARERAECAEAHFTEAKLTALTTAHAALTQVHTAMQSDFRDTIGTLQQEEAESTRLAQQVAALTQERDRNDLRPKDEPEQGQSIAHARQAHNDATLHRVLEAPAAQTRDSAAWHALSAYGYVHSPRLMTLAEAITSEIESYRKTNRDLRARAEAADRRILELEEAIGLADKAGARSRGHWVMTPTDPQAVHRDLVTLRSVFRHFYRDGVGPEIPGIVSLTVNLEKIAGPEDFTLSDLRAIADRYEALLVAYKGLTTPKMERHE